MRELISLFGVELYVLELSGILSYTIKRIGKDPKTFKIFGSDFDAASPPTVKEGNGSEKPTEGIEISISGLRLELVKNGGRLEVKFEDCDGRATSWEFEGLKEIPQRPLAASMGHEQMEGSIFDLESTGRFGFGWAADRAFAAAATTVSNISISLPTRPRLFNGTRNTAFTPDRQTGSDNLRDEPLSPEIDNDVSSGEAPAISHCQTPRRSPRKTGIKRAPLSPDYPSFHKKLKTENTKPSLPKYLFATLCRNFPTFKGEEGTLIIDTKLAKMHYTGWATPNTYIKESVNLSSPGTSVSYTPVPRTGVDSLLLSQIPSPQSRSYRLFEARRDAQLDAIWGNSTGREADEDIIYTDPEIIVDAIVYCIDQESGCDLYSRRREYEGLGKLGRGVAVKCGKTRLRTFVPSEKMGVDEGVFGEDLEWDDDELIEEEDWDSAGTGSLPRARSQRKTKASQKSLRKNMREGTIIKEKDGMEQRRDSTQRSARTSTRHRRVIEEYEEEEGGSVPMGQYKFEDDHDE